MIWVIVRTKIIYKIVDWP